MSSKVDFEVSASTALNDSRPLYRFGCGYDVHRFIALPDGEKTTHIMLCGVPIEHDMRILAHSDGDVGIHALVDAILGAISSGDIGVHFPPTDPQFAGMSSSHFLQHAVNIAATKGYKVSNADVTILCERPKISPHRDAMRNCLANIIGIDPEYISVKATTTEKLGYLGRREGIAADAVVGCVRI